MGMRQIANVSARSRWCIVADLAVGDVLTTTEQLDSCPVGTIVYNQRDGAALLIDGPQEPHWSLSGKRGEWTSFGMLDQTFGWTVVWLPPPPPITEVMFEATVLDVGCDGAVGPAVVRDTTASWLDLEPLIGKAVVVTVRVKEADDE